MVRARRQQGDARVLTAAARDQGRSQVLEVGRKPDHVALLEQVRREVRMHDPVGKREADAGQRLGVIVDHAPAAFGVAGKIRRVELQTSSLGKNRLARPQECAVGEHELGRDQALAQ